MTWTINRKLLAVTVMSVASIALLAVAILVVSRLVSEQVEVGDRRAKAIHMAANLSREITELNLVAMDTIAKKGEGKISTANLDQVKATQRESAAEVAALRALIDDKEDLATINDLGETVRKSASMIENELGRAVAAFAAGEAKMAELDDRIDATKGQVAERLTELDAALQPLLANRETLAAETRSRLLEMNEANIEINLVAMDAMIDRGDLETALETLKEAVTFGARARKDLAALSETFTSADAQAQIRAATVLYETYATLVTVDLKAAIEGLNKVDGELAELDDMFDGLTSEALHKAKKLEEKLLAAGHAATEETEGLLGFMFWGALVFGLVMFTIVAVVTTAIGRSIVGALRQFVGVMRQLADGQLTVEVPGKERGDEIREMAEALQVFKDSAIEIDNIRKAQQRAGEEIDVVVAAAAAGDFTARVELAGKDGFMLGLAKSLNTLVETVNRGLSEVMGVAAALSEGDLSRRVTGDYQGAFLKLRQDLNGMGDKLSSLVSDIRSVTEMVNNAAGELSQGADDLAQRTESQAASLEETAAAMEEMTSTIKRNSENSVEANKLVSETQTNAEHGGEVMKSTVAAMAEIESSSRAIAEIVNVIDDIALQTNLLALNASVEAARAGDAGRGFAVVASEVRSLAQRSGEAANQIKSLIAASTNHVGNGVKLANETGQSLTQIITSVQKVATIMAEVARASEEQSAGLGEVNAAVSQMDDMTQQNAALVEETSAAVQALGGQTAELAKLVSFFRLGEASARRQIRAA